MLPELVTAVPGPRSLELAARLKAREAREVTWFSPDFPIFWERGDGALVWDVDGNRFVDFTAAFATSSLGHASPVLAEASRKQSDRLLHAMGDVHPTEEKVLLCEELSRITFERWGVGPGRVLLGNTGSEAVEAALKTALLYSGKPGVIAFRNSYHGLGLGALEATGMEFFRRPFHAQLARFAVHLPYPACYRCPFDRREGFRLEGSVFPNCSTTCLDAIRNEIESAIRKREIGCVIVEPIQGRGGEIAPPKDFLTMVRTICSEHKILLIADEIYTGFLRTGRMFACEHFGVVPDVICLGKAMSGGFPISACVGRADIMDAWPVSEGEALHTSTTLGNPIGCAMAVAAIAEFEKLASQVKAVSQQLRGALQSLSSPSVGDVRGAGLMLGVELVRADGSPDRMLAASMMLRALKDGLILLSGGPDGNVLSFSPPFSIEQAQIGFLQERLQEYLTSRPGSVS